MAIVTGCDLDEFTVLERQVIPEACRANIVAPDALWHRHEDVDRSPADGVVDALARDFVTSSIALGSPQCSFTSQGLAPSPANRPWPSSARALPIVTTGITAATPVATLSMRLIGCNLPGEGR